MNRISFLLGIFALSGLANANVFLVRGDEGRYSLSFWEAYEECHSRGAALASKSDLEAARQEGYSACSCGWLSDHTAGYPIIEQDSESCGVSAGVHTCDWRTTWNAYCIGYEPMMNCSRPLGLETGAIRDEQFAAPSVNKAWWGEPWSPHLATLNRGGLVNAWMPNHDGRNQYLEISFEENMAITGIMTQGASRYTKWQYVTEYKLAFTRDGSNWSYYLDGKVFDGNSDNDGHVRNWFNPPIEARQIRIYPYKWVKHITLRVELFGCTLEEHDITEDYQKLQKN